MAFWKPSRPKDVEPAVTSAPAPVAASKPKVTQPARPAELKPVIKLLDAADNAAAPQNKGFDPYNSGAFNLKDTWSKVNRKK